MGTYKPGRMIHGAYKSYWDGSLNLVAIVWQDNIIVRLVRIHTLEMLFTQTGDWVIM